MRKHVAGGYPILSRYQVGFQLNNKCTAIRTKCARKIN